MKTFITTAVLIPITGIFITLVISILQFLIVMLIFWIQQLAKPEINDKQQVIRNIETSKSLLDARVSSLSSESDITNAGSIASQYLLYHLYSTSSNRLKKIKCTLYCLRFFTECTLKIISQTYLTFLGLVVLLLVCVKAIATKTQLQDVTLNMSASGSNRIGWIQSRPTTHIINMQRSLQNLSLL